MRFAAKLMQPYALLQDARGCWRTLLNQPDGYLETSGTAGFTYARC
ncbi:MAG: glycoside hydrolase family 88 protein [Symbiopectobacterium sp.]